MAITIEEPLRGTPSPTSLPVTITLRQTLASTQSSEQAQIVYRLAASNNVTFASGSKETSRTETVSNTGTRIEHRVRLVGSAADLAWIVIFQTITDEGERVTRDSCRIVLDQ